MAKAESTTNEGWTTVSETQPITEIVILDVVGDVFEGTYLGPRTIDPGNGKDKFVRYAFQKDDGVYGLSANASLREGMARAKVGALTRVTFAEEHPHPSGDPDMSGRKEYTVQQKR